MIKNIDQLLTRVGYIYLNLPFLIFTGTWLAYPYAIISCLIIIISGFFSLKKIKNDATIAIKIQENKKQINWILALMLVFLFFSGIGSFSYQSNDFLYRNAILRDLINFEWPVLYHIKGFTNTALEGKTTMMTYYIGFFLPAGLIGKLFGVYVAQLFLFFWSYLGLVLCLFQLCKFFNRFNFKVALLFLSWGTLFFLGSIYKYSLSSIFYDKEYLWAGMILYAESNIGAIYWIFNQVLTAWLIILFVFNNESKSNLIFLYSLCLFLSPFSCVGFFPFVLYYFFQNFDGQVFTFKNWIKNLGDYLSFQNLLGTLIVLIVSYFYLTSNEASNIFRVLHTRPKILISFILLSWGFVAILIFNKYRKDPLYWLVIAVLMPLPLFQLGNGIDFPGRISLPAMFILMLLVGKYLISFKHSINTYALYIILTLSGIWHFMFDPGKSFYYTTLQYISHHTNIDETLIQSKNPTLNNVGKSLSEIKSKDILTKDFITLSNPKNDIIGNYMSDTEKSFFYKYLAKKPNQ